MNESELLFFAQVFKALADATRQRILELLRAQGEMTVTDIAGNFDLAQPTISQHLRILKEAQAVAVRKSGQHMHYRVCNDATYDAMKEFMQTYKAELQASADNQERATTI